MDDFNFRLIEQLHPNHSLCVQLKTRLVLEYNKIKDKTFEQVSRQLELAEQVLEVMNKIDPGLTPRRGEMLKHVVNMRMKKANMEVKKGDIDRVTHMKIIKTSMLLMKEVMKCCRIVDS